MTIDTSTVKAVGRFNKHERHEVNDLFENTVQLLNTKSIGSVCFTDGETVDLVIQEIFA